MFTVLPIVFGLGAYVFSRFSGGFGFTGAISPDGIRLRHGLLETRSQTIPPGRVQAIRIQQGLLWRAAGWWRVEVNVAGYARRRPTESRPGVLLPGRQPRRRAAVPCGSCSPTSASTTRRPLLDALLAGPGDEQRLRHEPPTGALARPPGVASQRLRRDGPRAR